MPVKPKAKKVAAKAAKPAKAAKRPAAKAAKKAAKPVVAVREPVRPKPETLPGHHATKGEFARHMSEAEHAHQDPRWATEKPGDRWDRAHTDPRMDQAAIKTRGVPRMNKMVNWFRRAPKKGT
ncbi:MAG: hypothetical protein V4510_11165 [bacterium]